MSRFAVAVCLLALVCSVNAQTTLPSSDPAAVSLAIKSVAALTGGQPISDATLNATVISILGSDYETGTATLQAKGATESRIDLSLGNETRTDVRNVVSGVQEGAWSLNGSKATAYSQANCWTDAGWFIPVMGILSQNAVSKTVFTYVGLEQYNGLSAQHIRVFRLGPFMTDIQTAQRLTTVDFYLDPNSYLPLGIVSNSHLDSDVNTNVPTETRFSNYQVVSGIEVPFHIQRLLNGSLMLDITVTSAQFNTGLPDSLFTLQ